MEAVKLLLEKKPQLSTSPNGPIASTAHYMASRNGHEEVLALLKERALGDEVMDEKKFLSECFFGAAKAGRIADVKDFLAEGADIAHTDPFTGDTALIVASRFGHLEVVRILLGKQGYPISHQNKATETALIAASEHGYAQIVKLLIAAGRLVT